MTPGEAVGVDAAEARAPGAPAESEPGDAGNVVPAEARRTGLLPRLSGLPERTARWATWATVAAGILVVRAALWVGGYGFSTAWLESPSLWHLLDPAELRANPVAPIWDLHTQPPLFNVFVGSVLRWSPLPNALSFQLIFTVGALVGAVALYEIVRAYGTRRWVAATATIVAFSDPMLLAHEHQVMQEPLTTPLLLITAWACVAYARDPSLGRLAGFVGAGTVLALTRPQFHPVWLIAGVVLVMAIRPPAGSRRKVALVAALPLVVLGGLMAKNEVRFGEPTLSSWFGMNLMRTTVMVAPPGQVDALVAAGDVSPLASEWPFRRYETYAPHVGPCTAEHGTPRLDAAAKSDGSPNFNHVCYVAVYKQAQHDALAFIRAEPGTYVRSVAANATIYVAAPLSPDLPGRAGGLLEGLHDALALEVQTDVAYPVMTIEGVRVQVTVVLAIFALAVTGAAALLGAARGRRSPATALAAFVGFTVVFVSATSVLFDSLENARFRSPIDPLLWAAAVAFLLEGAARLAARRRAPGDVSADTSEPRAS